MINRQNQSGLSLIELMLGIVLSSLIIAGVLYIFNGSRASSLLIEAESKMLDEAQFAMENMNSVIRMAGYTMDPMAGIDSIVVNTGSPTVTADVIQGEEGGAEPDGITVWYEGSSDESVFDCHGETIGESATSGTGELRSNRYFVSDTGSLSCEIDNNDSPQPLIDDVADLQILYGIDTDTAPDGVVNQYKKYNQLSGDERLSVVSVMLALTLEATITGDRLEKTFTSTIYLRNRSL